MKETLSFQSFYDSKLLPILQGIEDERKKVFNRLMLGALLLVACIALQTYLGALPVLAVGAALFFYYRKESKPFSEQYKQKVIRTMVKGLGEGLMYEPDRCIQRNDYDRSELFPQYINRYSGDDLVAGVVDKTEIHFSELFTQHESGSGEDKKVTTIFWGIFFVADFNKKFAGKTVVLPDTAEKLFGSFGNFLQKMNASRPPLVKLENVEFEKEFAVYGTDQVEARYILSPALMERILDFKKKTGLRLSMSFIDSRIFIAITINKNLFEAPFLWRSVLDTRLLEEYFGYLKMCIGVVEDLDLNTRIWTKE